MVSPIYVLSLQNAKNRTISTKTSLNLDSNDHEEWVRGHGVYGKM